jgi:hypothetical protein
MSFPALCLALVSLGNWTPSPPGLKPSIDIPKRSLAGLKTRFPGLKSGPGTTASFSAACEVRTYPTAGFPQPVWPSIRRSVPCSLLGSIPSPRRRERANLAEVKQGTRGRKKQNVNNIRPLATLANLCHPGLQSGERAFKSARTLYLALFGLYTGCGKTHVLYQGTTLVGP